MSSVTPADTARHLRRRAAEAEAQGSERARQHRSRLPDAVTCLRQCYGARLIVLFGSVANATCHVDSDVDLAVSDLEPVLYFKALADLMAIFEGPVDLVRLEEAPPSLRECIDAEGEEL